MRFVLYTNVPSPHQLPLATELASLAGVENFRYVYVRKLDSERSGMGWATEGFPAWCVPESAATADWLEGADAMLVGGIRPIELMERRVAKGLRTFYMSERWFKPIPVLNGLAEAVFRLLWRFGVYRRFEILVPGMVRMFVPSYRRMAQRFAALFASDACRYLPIGPIAANDMRRMLRMVGRGGKTAEFIPWGYFVTPSTRTSPSNVADKAASDRRLRVLWVGRMIALKHVETIVKAVASCSDVALTLLGDGPEKMRLQELAAQLGVAVEFRPSVKIGQIRGVMREHDVYAFASNGFDGWGAVVSEALEEGLEVVGTVDSGASATLLPAERRFRCGDWRRLAEILGGLAHEKRTTSDFTRLCRMPSEWTAKGAAARLFAFFRQSAVESVQLVV